MVRAGNLRNKGLCFLSRESISSALCNWNVNDGSVTLNGKTVKLETRSQEAVVRKIYAAEDISVPPQSQLNLPVKSITVVGTSKCCSRLGY